MREITLIYTVCFIVVAYRPISVILLSITYSTYF